MSIKEIIEKTRSATAIAELSNFKGVVNLNADKTEFIADMDMRLGINLGGTIKISQKDVDIAAKKYGISIEMAQMEVAIHELGHEHYAAKDALAFDSSVAGREAWCYNREGEASYFGFTIALEAQANGLQLGVLGPASQPNLFTSMLNFSHTLSGNPQSLVYQNAMITFAKNIFANDPQYQAFCKAWAKDPTKAIPPLFIPPDDPHGPANDTGSSSGGGGSTGGGSGGSSPIGGGYWNPLPIETNPSSLPAIPVDQPYAAVKVESLESVAQLIGTAQLQNHPVI